MLDQSVITQRPNVRSREYSKLGGFSSSTNKGFAGIFGHSSMADYSQNLKKINETNLINVNFSVGLDAGNTKKVSTKNK